MFERLVEAPRDAILGLAEAFREDANPRKINLTVGVYKDASGETPTLECVRQAEARLAAELSSKAYLPIDGAPRYAQAVQDLLWSGLQPPLEPGRSISSHTPGGTGALRVAADFLRANFEESAVWFTDPTWANHPNIFSAAGVSTDTIPYFDATRNALDFDAFADGIRSIPPGDVLVLHACCHNPTGVDPTPKQWRVIAELIRSQRILPLVDFAYQGFGEGLREDAAGLHTLVSKIPEMLIASSFSKNFGLYRERVGALTVVAATPDTARKTQSQIKRSILRKLLQSTRPRRSHRDHGPRRQETSSPMGAGSRPDAKADCHHAVAPGGETLRAFSPW